MRTNHKGLLWSNAAAAALLLGCGTAATAQGSSQVADQGDDGQDIIVTARRRAEQLIDVPVSATAFSERQIEDARIDQVGDFIQLAPNISISETQNVGSAFITVRGITQVRNSEPPVAIVVDGVLQTSPAQLTQELFDIERIEVLRGPQGALYGRNATGGAILVTTRQPSNEVEGHIRVGIGKGEERLVQGSVSGPIVPDRLLFRIGARYSEREGYLRNVVLDEFADPFEDFSVRGLLVWNPADNFTVDLRGTVSRAEGGSLNFNYQPALLAPDGVTLAPGPFPFDFTRGDANDVDRTFIANNPGFNDRSIDEISLKLELETTFATFTSISAWNRIEEYLEGDQFPYTAALTRATLIGTIDGTQTQFLDTQAWSQEVRIASPGDRRLRWMVGGYYLETDRFISTTTGDDRGRGIIRVERRPLPTDANNPTLSFFADDNDNTAWAVFGDVAFDITRQLEIDLAVRYDEDERVQRVSPQNSGGVPGALNQRVFSMWQPKATLRYQPIEDLNIYGAWGRGFRSGQFNQNGVGAAAAAAGLIGVQDVADQEETETWEIGIRSELLDNRLRLSGALFDTDVQGQHYFVFIGQVGAQVLVNIDRVHLQGLELEASANVARGIDLFASLGITDSEITTYRLNPAAVGNRAPYVPSYKLNLGAQFRTPITDRVGLMARVDYERLGSQYWDPENTTARSPVDLIDLRFGIEDRRRRWSLTATFENVTDEVYNSEWVLGGFAHPAVPRVWHLDFRYNF